MHAVLAAMALASCASPADLTRNATDTASVVCEASGTRTQPEAVRANADGIHLSIDNLTERRMFLYYRIGDDIRPVGELRVGSTTAVVTAAPSNWDLVCVAPSAYPDEGDTWAALSVLDPEGVWVSDVLDCDRIAASHPDYREDFEGGTPQGQEGDPIELARDPITGAAFTILADDVLERAGYPAADPVLVRVLRDGRTVAIGSFQPDGHGGWIDRGAEYCEA